MSSRRLLALCLCGVKERRAVAPGRRRREMDSGVTSSHRVHLDVPSDTPC